MTHFYDADNFLGHSYEAYLLYRDVGVSKLQKYLMFYIRQMISMKYEALLDK